jgi:hypothetical protein
MGFGLQMRPSKGRGERLRRLGVRENGPSVTPRTSANPPYRTPAIKWLTDACAKPAVSRQLDVEPAMKPFFDDPECRPILRPYGFRAEA